MPNLDPRLCDSRLRNGEWCQNPKAKDSTRCHIEEHAVGGTLDLLWASVTGVPAGAFADVVEALPELGEPLAAANAVQADGLATLAAEVASGRARESERRRQLVERLTSELDENRFTALWKVAVARRDASKRARTSRPSHANVTASWSEGYVEGLRDALCLLVGADIGDWTEVSQVLEAANEETDVVVARNRLTQGPRPVVSSRLML